MTHTEHRTIGNHRIAYMLSVEGDDPKLEATIGRAINDGVYRLLGRLRVGMSRVTVMPDTEIVELTVEGVRVGRGL